MHARAGPATSKHPASTIVPPLMLTCSAPHRPPLLAAAPAKNSAAFSMRCSLAMVPADTRDIDNAVGVAVLHSCIAVSIVARERGWSDGAKRRHAGSTSAVVVQAATRRRSPQLSWPQ